MFSLPNIIDQNHNISKLQWKQMVRKVINEKYGNLLKPQISGYSKLKEDLKRKVIRLICQCWLPGCSSESTVKTNVIKMNQQSNKTFAKQLWKCSECGNIDMQSHVLWCPYFASLREGKSLDNDLI